MSLFVCEFMVHRAAYAAKKHLEEDNTLGTAFAYEKYLLQFTMLISLSASSVPLSVLKLMLVPCGGTISSAYDTFAL